MPEVSHIDRATAWHGTGRRRDELIAPGCNKYKAINSKHADGY
jgi:hypothetical protein